MPKVYAIDGVIPVVAPSAFVHPTAVLIGDVIVGSQPLHTIARDSRIEDAS